MASAPVYEFPGRAARPNHIIRGGRVTHICHPDILRRVPMLGHAYGARVVPGKPGGA
jgi:hypothetical protein